MRLVKGAYKGDKDMGLLIISKLIVLFLVLADGRLHPVTIGSIDSFWC